MPRNKNSAITVAPYSRTRQRGRACSSSLPLETNGGPDVLSEVEGVLEQVKKLNLGVASRAAIDWRGKDSVTRGRSRNRSFSRRKPRLDEHIAWDLPDLR